MGKIAHLLNKEIKLSKDSKSLVSFVIDGMAHGKYFLYYENGQVFLEGNWVNGKPHGLTRTYHTNGKLMHEINFKNDVYHGAWKEWDERGKLIRQGEYEDGNLVSWWECDDANAGQGE